MLKKDINISKRIQSKDVCNCLLDNYSYFSSDWIYHQWNWLHQNYSAFNDLVKYFVAISLVRNTLRFYDQNGFKYNYEEYYARNEIQISEKGVFWDKTIADQNGQWNPVMKVIHPPLQLPTEKEESRQKTEQKLSIERERNTPWPDLEGVETSSNSMAENPIVGNEFQGLGGNGWSPPDNAGAISGSGHIVTCINSRIGFYDEDGNQTHDQSLSDFFSPISPDASVYDPKVEYSNYHNKFVGSKRSGVIELHDYTKGNICELTYSPD